MVKIKGVIGRIKKAVKIRRFEKKKKKFLPVGKKKKRLPSIPKERAAVLVALIFIIAISAYFYWPTNCGSDEACFSKAAAKCSRAQATDIKEGTIYSYTIKGGSSNGACAVEIELQKLSENADPSLVKLLEGKEMYCRIPKEEFAAKPLADVKEVSDYCSGPLKEALLDLIIERLYGLIISNIGSISMEMQEKLTEVS